MKVILLVELIFLIKNINLKERKILVVKLKFLLVIQILKMKKLKKFILIVNWKRIKLIQLVKELVIAKQ